MSMKMGPEIRKSVMEPLAKLAELKALLQGARYFQETHKS